MYNGADMNKKRFYGKHAVKGGVWLLGLKFTHRLLGIVRTVILARLLAPVDFGLMGIAVLAVNMLDTFSRTGFEQALIREKENIRGHLDTAWTMQVLRGTVLFAVLFLAAPLVAGFFKRPEAVDVIRALSFMQLIAGFRNIGTVFFDREMRFNKKVMLGLSGLIPNMLVSIVLAFTLRNVWALVWGGLAGVAATSVCSYFMHPYRPRLRFYVSRAGELFGFGKWLLGSSIIIFLATQGDDAFVGRVLGISALGLYQMAYHISNTFTTEVTHVISRVMFPAYSKLQDDLKRMAAAYLEVFSLNAFFSLMVFSGLVLFAGDFTRIFLGDKWLPAVAPLRVLAVAGLFRSMASATGVVFHSMGKPRIDTFWQSVRLAVLVIFIVPLTALWGLVGVSVAVCLSIGISTAGFMASLIKQIPVSPGALVKMIIWPGLSALVMYGAGSWSRTFFSAANILSFAANLLIAMAVYFLSAWTWDRLYGYRIYDLITKRLKEVFA
ncbi:MAG: oligosaccharide flippase family protein [Candidatus Omnitrophica bacterium]|nr:oligosaccharide flippase family protein [Candidatus Omnitrophota bacterium]